jgi:DmsE family decaheme c-type cytochrome
MTMSIRAVLGGIALLLFCGLSPGYAQEQQPPATPAPAPAAAQEVPQEASQPEATMSCSDCHELAKDFVKNPHARGEVTPEKTVPNAVCETCHDGATAHMEAGGDPSLVTVPRGFKGTENTCLGCHDRTTERRTHRFGAHANSPAVNCLSCHTIHHATQDNLVARPQPQLCATCHGTQAASLTNRPYGHRFGSRVMACSTCHDPHARPGRENIRLSTAGETACLGCHSDKRGPYVFQHGGTVAGEADCSSCHEPHGSSNPNSLRRGTVAQLCLECHSPLTATTLGSQPPSFHNLNNPRYQNCTTCHVAVHGSNRSPQLLK